MIKRFFTLLTFSLFIIAVAFSGCSPIGGLLVSDVEDHIRAEPKRFVYSDQYDPFIPADPEEGVEVFSVIKGIEKPVSIEDVEITVKDSSWGNPIKLSEEDKEEGILLDPPGIKDVTISYKGMETFYRIYVGAEAGDGGSGTPGITIKLPDDWVLKFKLAEL